MAKPNYQFEKRQRDLAKKRKQEEKQRQKAANKALADGSAESPADATPPENDSKGTASPDRDTKPEE